MQLLANACHLPPLQMASHGGQQLPCGKLHLVPEGSEQLVSFCGNVVGQPPGFPPEPPTLPLPPKPLTLPLPPEPLTLPPPPEPPEPSLLVEPPHAARVETEARVTTKGARKRRTRDKRGLLSAQRVPRTDNGIRRNGGSDGCWLPFSNTHAIRVWAQLRSPTRVCELDLP